MLAKVLTCAVVGLEGELVQVEVDIARQGRSNCTIVGLTNTAVQEAREQVRAAVRNSGLVFPAAADDGQAGARCAAHVRFPYLADCGRPEIIGGWRLNG